MLTFYENLPISNTVALFDLKQLLVSVGGWIVQSSSDGTTFDPNGDVIVSGGGGPGGLANNNAWFRISSGDGAIEWTLQRGPNTTSWRVKLGRAAFDAGTPGPTQTPQTVDPNDSMVVVGAGTDAVPQFGQLMGGGDGATRVKAAVDDANSSFYFAGFPSGGGNPTAAFILERMALHEPRDQFPFVMYSPVNDRFVNGGLSGQTTSISGQSTFSPDGTDRPPLTNGTGGRGITALRYSDGSGTTMVPNNSPVDPITGAHSIWTMAVARLAQGVTGNAMYKGVYQLMRWNGVPGSATGDTYSLDSPRDRIVIGDINLPWNGTVPTNGAASTDRTASMLVDWNVSYSETFVGSNIEIAYLMEGYDSLGQLVTWTALFPDFSATEYDGPNTPITNVAISGRNVAATAF